MTLDVRWVTAFIDVGNDDFDTAVAFWSTVTGTTPSPRRGDRGQFTTLERVAGDASLRVQGLDGVPRVHLDLHVASLDEAQQQAERLGATLIDDPGHRIMRSPGGIVFCFVGDHGERDPGPLIDDPMPHNVDQVCLDVPAQHFEAEVAFWAELLGWPGRPSATFAEFARLRGGDELAFTFLLQRLGADDRRTEGVVHLDISCGEHRLEVVEQHVRLGAVVVDTGAEWTVMRGPAGQIYCLTNRLPTTRPTLAGGVTPGA